MRRLLSPTLLAALLVVPAAADAAPRVTAAEGRLAVTYDDRHRTRENFGALAVAPDGTVFAGGAGGLARRSTVTAIARDGRLVRGFGDGGGARAPFPVREVDVLLRAADGTLYAIGRLDSDDGSTAGPPAVVRLSADGTFDRAYGLRPVPGLIGIGCLGCQSAALAPDGGLVVAGRSGSSRAPRFAVAKLRPDGTPDRAFGVNGVAHPLPGEGAAAQLAVRADGRMVVEGTTGPLDEPDASREIVIGLRADGSRDPSFEIVEPFADAYSLQLDAAGRLLVATSATGRSAAVERYDVSGRADATWGGDGRVSLGGVGVPKIVAAGAEVVVAAKGFREPLVRVALSEAGRVVDRSQTRLTFGGGTFRLGPVVPQLGTPDWGPQALAMRPDGSLALAGGVFLTLGAEGDSRDATEAALALVRSRGGFVRTPRSKRPPLRVSLRRERLGAVVRRGGVSLRFVPRRRGLARVVVRAGGRIVARGGVPFWTARPVRERVPLTAAGRRLLRSDRQARVRVRIARTDMAGNRRSGSLTATLRR